MESTLKTLGGHIQIKKELKSLGYFSRLLTISLDQENIPH